MEKAVVNKLRKSFRDFSESHRKEYPLPTFSFLITLFVARMLIDIGFDKETATEVMNDAINSGVNWSDREKKCQCKNCQEGETIMLEPMEALEADGYDIFS